MKRNRTKWLLFLAIPCVLVAAGYFALLQFYREHIPYGTWINDVYCTGLTYEEAAKQVQAKEQFLVKLEVIDNQSKTHLLELPESCYSTDYLPAIETKLDSFSFLDVFDQKHIWVTPDIQMEKEAVYDFLKEQPYLQPAAVPQGKRRIEIIETDAGFVLTDYLENLLDFDMAAEAVFKALSKGEDSLDLARAGCYKTPPYSETDKAVLQKFEALKAFTTRITYKLTIGDETYATVDASVIKNWLTLADDGSFALSEDGGFILDKKRVKDYVEEVAYDTTTYFGKDWEFLNHNGKTISVPAGNYGRALKTAPLYETLLEAYEQGESGSYELEFRFYPESAGETGYGGLIGDSYVEVDLTEQTVFLYIDGRQVLSSPCVTGNVSWNMETPKGVFYVEYKQRNRVLKGEDYRTPVSYWMHFYNHCGFHDAGWRKKFGGDIYLEDGSHGCVNMPPEKAKELYGLVYKGMPVVVYE